MADAIDYSSLKKGGFMRQKQKGYFSLRLAVVGGNLTAENIKTIAEVAEKYGHGYVHMTSRQGVEIPFINFNDIEEVRGKLAEGGVKILKINGIEPTVETIADGSYPVSGGIYAIYRKGETNENVYKAVDFMLSPEGQKIVEDSGYIPVIKPD